MALLGGVKNKGKAAATNTKAPEPEAIAGEEVQVEVDIDSMDEEAVAGLVSEHEIPIPADWSKKDLAEKKAWLNEWGSEGDKVLEALDEKPAKAPRKPKAAASAPETPAPKPEKAKGKAVAASASKSGEVLPPDLISGVASELENLKEPEARKLVVELREAGDFGFFKLGGVLSVIQTNGWFAPHATLKEFVEAEHGLAYRRAMYWVAIYNSLVASGVAWEDVKEVGWTKLKEIAPVLTKANVKTWVKTAKKNSTLQLIEIVKAHVEAEKQKTIGTQEGGPEVAPALPVTTKTFKVHADQKKTIDEALSKAKEATKTEYDTVALEMICLDYLGGTGTSATVAGRLQKMGLEDALKAFEEAYPNVNLTAEVNEEQAEAA